MRHIFDGYSGFGAGLAWVLYDYQTLVAGVLAILAAVPVWLQLRETQRQTGIARIEFIRGRLDEFRAADIACQKGGELSEGAVRKIRRHLDPEEGDGFDQFEALHIAELLEQAVAAIAGLDSVAIEPEKKAVLEAVNALKGSLIDFVYPDILLDAADDEQEYDWDALRADAREADANIPLQTDNVEGAWRSLSTAIEREHSRLRQKAYQLSKSI